MENSKAQIIVSGRVIGQVFGYLDVNVRKIEKAFGVSIVNRGDSVNISGNEAGIKKAVSVVEKLISFAEKGEDIADQNVNYLISVSDEADFSHVDKIADEMVALTAAGRPVKPKTIGQKKYIDMIKNNTIVIGVGPAGTGKTYLAMAAAITAFKNNKVERIILTRPAIEAGEKLGFLPGDLQQKVDPYLRPLYDALHEIMGTENFQKNLEKGLIEVAPLAYMRGRTLNNAFIVLDEAQNTTPEQMKMFLTRIGFGSKAIITGDLTQIDLPDGKNSGLIEAIKVLEGVEDIGVTQFSNKDVVRHPLVAKIVAAYEKYDSKKQKRTTEKQDKPNTYVKRRTGRFNKH